MNHPLMTWTKIVLATSALVQFLMALVAFIAPDWGRSVLTSSQQSPTIDIQYLGACSLASALAASYALRQDGWIAARTYLAYAAPFVLLDIVITLLQAFTSGIRPISYLYLLLAVIYLPLVVWVWLQESKHAKSAA